MLEDHLYNTSIYADVEKVLCPRVNTELLTPYRGYLQSAVPESLADAICQDPAALVAWCNENLTLYNAISMRYIQISPRRVWETRIADKTSREIFFVAMCRSFGVPAWTDPVTGVLKYEKDGLVYDVDFEAVEQVVSPKGRLQLKYSEIPLLDDPKYEVHFTISKYDGGTFRLMDYDAGTWSQLFKKPAQMDCGYYMLVSGSRMSGGNVFADVEFFTIEEGKTAVVDLVMRDIKDQIRVIGSFDSEMKYISCEPGSDKRVEKSVFATEDDFRKFRAQDFNLPSTVRFGIDEDGKMRKMIASEMKLDKNGRLPLVVMADTFNRVVFFSQGYNIGLGDSLVKTSKAL